MLQSSTLDFFRELKQNNSKDWFDQNRKRYDKVKVDYLALTSDILERMKKVDHSLDMVTAKECIFRINRDVRFSKDKSPYKTNLGIALHPGGKKFNRAAYYLHIEEGHSFVGGGLWMPESQLLSKVRKEIHYFYKDFQDVINNTDFVKTYKDLTFENGQKLLRPPKGYEINDPAIEYLKLKSFTALTNLDDQLLTSDQLVANVVEKFTILRPFIQFINRGLISDEEGGI